MSRGKKKRISTSSLWAKWQGERRGFQEPESLRDGVLPALIAGLGMPEHGLEWAVASLAEAVVYPSCDLAIADLDQKRHDYYV
jgi:hypothetical protein